MSYRIKYDKIAAITKAKTRGFAFEALLNEIYDDCEVLISKSYKTADGTQQIDGAVQINSKIFLIEAKWEKKETLAASKLYSFLGKINSKMEGTLGVFISHEKLSNNFLKSIRNGLRQNCIVIHGPDEIANIIDNKLNLAEYTWYCFQQASTGHKNVDTAQFMSIPKAPKATTTLTPSASNNDWFDIYTSLTNSDTAHKFNSILIGLYSNGLGLSNKLINLFPTLPYSSLMEEKLVIIINKLYEEERDLFTKEIEKKFKDDNWRTFVVNGLLRNYICKKDFIFLDKKSIIENVTKKFSSDFHLENDASEVINLFYEKTTLDEKKLLALKYVDIYSDSFRDQKFLQKQFANKLFNDLKTAGIDIISVTKSKVIDTLLTYKNFENIFHTEIGEEYDLKKETINRVLNRYKMLFSGHVAEAKQMLEAEYENL
ncbi:hypothetical protein [Flavobacterium sp.]|jgi:hypothetical protein|uniref:hypothetical protein n=1 Tax=Flavobacterium sp. TaxID=239 RepID=UPI0037C0180B